MFSDDAEGAYNDILAEVGNAAPNIVLHQTSPVVVSEVDDTQSGGVPADYPHIALVLSKVPREADETSGLDATERRKLIIPAFKLAVEPKVFDTVTVNGKLWTVYVKGALMPDGVTPILWTLLVKR